MGVLCAFTSRAMHCRNFRNSTTSVATSDLKTTGQNFRYDMLVFGKDQSHPNVSFRNLPFALPVDETLLFTCMPTPASSFPTGIARNQNTCKYINTVYAFCTRSIYIYIYTYIHACTHMYIHTCTCIHV